MEITSNYAKMKMKIHKVRWPSKSRLTDVLYVKMTKETQKIAKRKGQGSVSEETQNSSGLKLRLVINERTLVVDPDYLGQE